MPYFKIMLSGRGIDLQIDGIPVIGFFTTRLVRAPDPVAASLLAKDLVLSEWKLGSPYAAANRGAVPAMTVESCFPVGFLAGTFGRKPSGYTFYSHED